jgi:hypothetical protein
MTNQIGDVAGSSLEALAEFLTAIEAPDFSGGEMVAPPAKNGVLQMPYAKYAAVVSRFHKAAYENGWVLRDFDWMEWAKSKEAHMLRGDKGAVEHASASQLMKLLTVCIRSERFCEGALLDAFEAGLVLRVVRRAQVLAGNERPAHRR